MTMSKERENAEAGERIAIDGLCSMVWYGGWSAADNQWTAGRNQRLGGRLSKIRETAPAETRRERSKAHQRSRACEQTTEGRKGWGRRRGRRAGKDERRTAFIDNGHSAVIRSLHQQNGHSSPANFRFPHSPPPLLLIISPPTHFPFCLLFSLLYSFSSLLSFFFVLFLSPNV